MTIVNAENGPVCQHGTEVGKNRHSCDPQQPCNVCGKEAIKKITYLDDRNGGARNNPNSSAYQRDDCSWCEDACVFGCVDHYREMEDNCEQFAGDGYGYCSTFEKSERFKHLFAIRQEDKS